LFNEKPEKRQARVDNFASIVISGNISEISPNLKDISSDTRWRVSSMLEVLGSGIGEPVEKKEKKKK